MSENWKELLRISLNILDSAMIKPDSWTMGGGTVLMLHYNHRRSEDIDIFFNDVQYITYVSPRLNDTALRYSSDYDEQSNFLKLRFNKGEIDFIAAPRLTLTEPDVMTIDNITVRTDQPEEIVIKKLFYRAESLKVRDIIDLSVVINDRKDKLLAHLDVFSSRLDIIAERLQRISRDFKSIAEGLDLIDARLADDALSIVQSFLKECSK